MTIFFGNEKLKFAVDSCHVQKIVLEDNVITICFHGGDYLPGSVVPRLESIGVKYENEKAALAMYRLFYIACRDGENAFYFDLETKKAESLVIKGTNERGKKISAVATPKK